MYYYAYIDTETGFCYDVIESEEHLEDPSYIEVFGLANYAAYAKVYPVRKTYENGFWRDTTIEEAEAMYSTNTGERITIGDEWLDIVINNKADIDHTHDGYATANHIHTNYVSSDDLQELEDIVGTKADTVHTHTEYAFATHSHSDYALQTSVDALETEIDGKANSLHSHTEYALSAHEHDEYAEVGHNHNASYSPVSHSHTEYATTVDFHELSSVVSDKANSSHSHDDRYYTKTEINNKLANKSDVAHNHIGVYDENGAAASALTSANAYTDVAIDALNETVATKADAATVSSHTGNTAVHITSAERTKLSGIAEGANNYILPSAGATLGGVKNGGDVTISSGVITVNDDSHNHVISNVDGLQSALDSKAASGHNHDGVYYTETEVDTLLEGKANTSHTHTVSNITNLQSVLDGKANTSHGTHVSYSTTTPVMDGTASVGMATTVARSDHKHPTDTSRAAQTSLDSHTSNKSNPHGVTLAQLGITATASELNALDGITATVTELNYVDGVTSNIQTQLNAKAESSHTHSYAGSSSVGGAATSANKLNTNAGDANTPVYFANGVPVACTSLDLNTSGSSASCTGNAATATNVAWSGVTSKPSYYDAKAIKSITRSGTTFTYTCMDGTTGTFTQQDNNTTYSAATSSTNGLMSSADKSKLDAMVLATVSEVETYLTI